VQNLKALAISASQNVSISQDVVTFNDTDSTAVPSEFTATINWGDSSSPTAGSITEDASGLFHVTGTHIYNSGGSFPITITIKDQDGTLYATGAFNQTNLVSSVAGMAGVTDPSLINPWGTSSSSTSPIWVSDQGSGLATVYDPDGDVPIKQALCVTIPKVGAPSGPTGQVSNISPFPTAFGIPGPQGTIRSDFLFATLDGTIAGWNPDSDGGPDLALTATTISGAVFTGLAQGIAGQNYYLYAADFTGTTGTNGIDVFDEFFTNVSGNTFAGKFTDPDAIAGYHPFNIVSGNGGLFVAYAQPSGSVTTGGGYIDEFDTSGDFMRRIDTDTAGTNLHGPWGMAIAPLGFGSFAGDLLVGNFGNATASGGNGTIGVINLTTSPGLFEGTLSSPNGTITNAGFWSLQSGNGGEGRPNSAGTVSQPGGPGTAFLVSGTHTYADSGVNGGVGHYPITVNVHDQEGLTLAISNIANVADVPLLVTGRLNPASDSGESNSDDITNVVQPNFIGTTSEPGATVTLYLASSPSPIVIGRGVSNANDAWSITANQALGDGSYTIEAVAVDSSGHTVSSTTTIVPTLVIDTAGPKVTNVNFNRVIGDIQVTILDSGGINNAGVGLNYSSLIDANNFSLTKYHQHGPAAFLVTSINVTPGTLAGSQLFTLQFNGGKYMRGGHYFFTVRSVSPTNATGVRDIAGNALDGEFYGYFPSGNNVRGGDFIAELDAVHHTIFAPKTVIGTATPVSPPGMLPSNTRIPTYNPGGPAHSSFKGSEAGKRLEHGAGIKKPAAPVHRLVHRGAVVQKIIADSGRKR
jgi:uncharacterized protein (TIGR03118 family)